MPAQFQQIILRVTQSFIETFNKRDFEQLKHFLASNFFVESENIRKIFPDNIDGRLEGVPAVIAYWTLLAENFPDLRFDPDIDDITNDGKNIAYRGKLMNGKVFQARFTMNEYAKIECMVMDYPESI